MKQLVLSFILLLPSSNIIFANDFNEECKATIKTLKEKSYEGNDQATLRLASLLSIGITDCVEVNEKDALSMIQPLVEKKIPSAYGIMGQIYMTQGGEYDLDLARKAYQKGKVLNDEQSYWGYAKLLSDSATSAEEMNLAIKAYEEIETKSLSKKSKYIQSLNKRLAVRNGIDSKDLMAAIAWFDKAEALGEQKHTYYRAQKYADHNRYELAIDNYKVFIGSDIARRLDNYFNQNKIALKRGLNKNISEKLEQYKIFPQQATYHFELARAYYFEYGDYKKDTEKAIAHYKLASDLGSAEAHLELGLIFFVLEKPEQGLVYLQRASEKEHSLANFKLFQYYSDSNSPARNFNKALKYLALIAEKEYKLSSRSLFIGSLPNK
ncbi:MAG: sel1 repeat family protein [Kangiellaceae bacterium]|nr:sel1 repeat family protein [Kangiellaceae bacterium]